MKNKKNIMAIFFAVLSAVYYGLNVPFSKLMLDKVPPVFMAAFLYLGAGLGIGIVYLFVFKNEKKEEKLTRHDLPYTILMIVLDVAAPVFLMLGVKNSNSANASLLGNFEIVATAIFALFIFKEKVSKKLWLAIALITVSSILLTFGGRESFEFSKGSFLVLAATLCWGFENNCTRKISGKSTFRIVILKGLCSGACSLVIAFISGEQFPEIADILPVLLLGFVAYGLSIFFYVKSQRYIGAAKTSAFYAIAPFIGAFLSFVINGDALTAFFAVALVLMIGGTAFSVWDTLQGTS